MVLPADPQIGSAGSTFASLSISGRAAESILNDASLNDPYETLEIERSATAEEVRKAYRRLAKTTP